MDLELVCKKLSEARRQGDRSLFMKPVESGLLLVFQMINQKHLLIASQGVLVVRCL